MCLYLHWFEAFPILDSLETSTASGRLKCLNEVHYTTFLHQVLPVFFRKINSDKYNKFISLPNLSQLITADLEDLQKLRKN